MIPSCHAAQKLPRQHRNSSAWQRRCCCLFSFAHLQSTWENDKLSQNYYKPIYTHHLNVHVCFPSLAHVCGHMFFPRYDFGPLRQDRTLEIRFSDLRMSVCESLHPRPQSPASLFWSISIKTRKRCARGVHMQFWERVCTAASYSRFWLFEPWGLPPPSRIQAPFNANLRIVQNCKGFFRRLTLRQVF